MADKIYNVLFLCTGNSARSIMAEALLTTMGKGRFKGFSAGSHPGGVVNPFAIEKVKEAGYPIENLRSKSGEEFAKLARRKWISSSPFCDNAVGEVCPIWPGQPISAHWGFEEPTAAQGSDEDKWRVFEKVCRQIVSRFHVFLSLPLPMLEKNAIQHEMKAIGETPIAGQL